MRMQVFTGYDHFSNKPPDPNADRQVKSTKSVCKSVARAESGSAELERLAVLEAQGVRFNVEVGELCDTVASRLLAGISNTMNASMIRGLIAHAAHTSDGGEILRIVKELAKKGTLQ